MGFDEDMQRFARFIRESKNIVVMSGTGISAACGIPVFRTEGEVRNRLLLGENLDIDFLEQNP